jgi:hypothetical protein
MSQHTLRPGGDLPAHFSFSHFERNSETDRVSLWSGERDIGERCAIAGEGVPLFVWSGWGLFLGPPCSLSHIFLQLSSSGLLPHKMVHSSEFGSLRRFSSPRGTWTGPIFPLCWHSEQAMTGFLIEYLVRQKSSRCPGFVIGLGPFTSLSYSFSQASHCLTTGSPHMSSQGSGGRATAASAARRIETLRERCFIFLSLYRWYIDWCGMIGEVNSDSSLNFWSKQFNEF